MFNHSITLRRATNTSTRANPVGMMIENCHDDDGWGPGSGGGNEPFYQNDTGELWCTETDIPQATFIEIKRTPWVGWCNGPA